MIKPLHSHQDSVAAQIHCVFQHAYQFEADLIGSESFAPLLRSADDIKASPDDFIGCYENQALAGVLEYAFSSGQLNINSLAIHPNFFRRGLASQLVEHVLQLRWATAIVQTAVLNAPAIALYKKSGFEDDHRWQTPDAIEMITLSISRSK